ncbi:MAG: hypothetical protein AAB797_01565 [Patescibacteria group bacterium]
MKNFNKILILSFLFVFAFTAAKPAKAFYLEVPQSVKNLLSVFKSRQTYAQDAGTMMPMPPSGDMTQQYPMPAGTQYPMPTQGTMPAYSGTMPTGMTPEMMQQYQTQSPGMMSSSGQYPTQGTQQYPMPPSGDQNKQYQGTQQNMPGNYDPNQQQGMQGDQRMNQQNPQDSARQLAEMKRNMKQMGSMVRQFATMIASAEKKGTAVPEEVKQNLAKLKSILDAVQNAKSMEELQEVDMGAMQELTESLEDFRRNVVEAQQRMDGMKRGMKGMEQGLKMFERQVAALTKKKITVPADILEHIAKLKSIVEKVKAAKSFDEIQEDMESMQDLMETFDQDRQQLEILARWPQSLKEINRQLTQLTSALKRSKSIVTSLAKKGIDLQSEYAAFEEGVNKLKSVRDDAVAKMAASDSEGAFSVLEDDFFGQMDDVWQHQKLIMTMSNLGRFASEFKRNMAQANSMVRNLKRKKVDTAELEALVAQANEKGQEILSVLKAKPVDTDALAEALDELENIKQEFEAKVDELTGQEDELPWERGPQQFRDINLPQGFEKLVPQRQESQTSQPIQVEPVTVQAL